MQVDVEGEDEDHEDQRDPDQQHAELAHAPLEIGLLRADPKTLGDRTELRVAAGPHDERAADSADDVGALK